ncbi:TPA: TcfC E-set like domain-containing protein [Photobacterium damselae]
MKIINSICYSCILLSSKCVLSLEVPDDFSELYNYSNKIVELRSVNGVRTDLEIYSNYDNFKIKNSSSKSELMKFLTKMGVNDSMKKDILNRITSNEGINSTSKCIGRIDNCIVNSDEYDFLYDYDNKKLYFYISPEYLNDKKRENIDYVPNLDTSPAIINSSDLYLSLNDSNISTNINNETTIGLPYGHIESNFSYNSNDNNSDEFDYRKLAYILNYKSYQSQIGLFDGTLEYNSTGFLIGTDDNTENISINISTSNNLIRRDSSYYQSLDYYSQVSGYLKVKKDDIIIYQNNVNAGSGHIPYSNLPRGVYDVEVTIESNGQIAFKKIYHIYNIKNGHLAKGERDYIVSIGSYHEDRSDLDVDSLSDSDIEQYTNSYFYRGLLSYGVNDSLMIGGEVEISSIDNNFKSKLGASYLFNNGSRLDVIYGQYREGSSSNAINVTTPWFSAYYNDVKINRSDSYATYLENSSSRKSISVNKNIIFTPVLSGSLMYNYNKYTSSNNNSDAWNITSSLDYRFGSGNILSAQLMYDKYNYEYSRNEEISGDINISVPIGNNLTYTAYMSNSDGNFDEFRYELTSNDLLDDDDKYLTLSAGHSIYEKDNQKTYLNMNGNYNSDIISSNVYGFLDSNGERNLNVGISNTQVISKNGVDFTGTKSKSYMKIDVDNTDERIKNLGLLTLHNNEKLDQKRFLHKENNLIPLKEYDNYQGSLDTESVSLENNGDKDINGFSFPGSVYHMNPKVGKIVSFIAAFDDIFDQKINMIECSGEACVDIENISGNIFNIKVRSGQEFVLKSDDLVCLTPGVKNIKNLNLGKNHCVPNIDDFDDGMMLAGPDGTKERIYYLGRFKKSERDEYLAKLLHYNVIEKEFNENDNIVYVSFKKDYLLTKNDRVLFDNVMLTAENSMDKISPFVLELDQSWFKE